MSNKGYLISVNGRYGRTRHSNDLINGKLVVYYVTEQSALEIAKFPNGPSRLAAICRSEYEQKGLLVDPKKVKMVGFID